MLSRRILLAFTALTVMPTLGYAAGFSTFTKSAFEKAQKDEKSIFIAIHAVWCSTCKAQAPIISALLKNPKFKDVLVFRVDFDDQVDIVRAFGAQSQSTLISFKGGTEMGRSVGDTNPASIEALLATAL